MDQFSCRSCKTDFPSELRRNGPVYDFRIRRPKSAQTKADIQWNRFQLIFEDVARNVDSRDKYEKYQAEIESVRRIYQKEFNLAGAVLDVGGYQGTLRHFLSGDQLESYVSVDPFLASFDGADQQALLRAYPCMSEPCNFLACQAEHLPFANGSFDWVHMRSVVDHFEDPFFSFKEAYRVLKPGGHIMIGLSIHDKMKQRKMSLATRLLQKIKHEGFLFAVGTALKKITTDDHNIRVGQEELIDWIDVAGFKIEKQYWQEPPFDYCLYLTAVK